MNVYVISASPEISKIGKADSPGSRLSGLSTSSPYKLEMYRVFPMASKKSALAVEKIAHATLSDKRMNGEWFAASPEVAAAAVQSAIVEYESPTCRDPRIQKSPNYPCGHERTLANSKKHGNGLACRTCRQNIERRAQEKKRSKIVVG